MLSLKSILLAIPAVVILDLVWVAGIASSFYQTHLRSILNIIDGKLEPRWIPAILTYVTMILLVSCVALPLARSYADTVGGALLIGALLGIVVYGLYNFTNLTLLKDWDWTIAIVDTLWGGVIFGLSTLFVWKFS